MSTEQNQNVDVDTQNNEGEGTDKVQLSKSEYEELVGIKSSYGSLKREFKDLKKSLDEKPDDTPQKTKSDEFGLLEKAFLNSVGVKDADEIELIKKWAKDTGKTVDMVAEHPFVKAELENLRQSKANLAATSNIKGDARSGSGSDKPEYWIAKGEAPPKTSENRKLRAQIAHKLIGEAKGEGKKFYND